MFDKLREIELNYEENQRLLCDPAVLKDPARLTELTRKQKQTEEVVEEYRVWKRLTLQEQEAEEWLNGDDAEMRALAKEELRELKEAIREAEARLKVALLPKDPDDD